MKSNRIIAGAVFVAASLVPSAAFAHAHTAGPKDQVIANGALHPPFVNGTSCEGESGSQGNNNAWYGLETAHHGPDQGDPGKGDGCYYVAGGPLDPDNDRNPAID